MAWDLTGNADATSTSFLGSTNAQPLVVRAGPTPSATPPERLRVLTDGRIGIGTTTPQARLSVAGGGATLNGVAVGTDVSGISYPNRHETVGVTNLDHTLRLQSPSGLAFHTGPPGTTVNDSLKATITPSGEMGVGKVPGAGYRLDVAGTVNAADYHKNGAPMVSSQWSSTTGGISYGGNLGVGKAPDAAYKLDVAGDVAIRGSAVVGAGGWGRLKVRHVDGKHYQTDDDEPLLLNWATGMPVYVGFGHGNQSSLYVSGNVGIGTETQYGRVNIEHDSVPLSLRETGQSSTAGGFWRMPLDAGMWRFDVNTAAAGDFSSYLTPLTMHPTGDVGLGRNLNVAGQLRWGNSAANPDSIELGAPDGSAPGVGTPFIDFHFRGLAQDFNTRIINDENGKLTMVAPTLGLTGNLRFADGSVQTTAYRLLIQNGEVGTGALSASSGHVDRPIWVRFPTPFAAPPAVVLAIKTLDVDHRYNQRVEVWVGNTTASGFDAVFRTWADTRIYLVTATWMAYGSR